MQAKMTSVHLAAMSGFFFTRFSYDMAKAKAAKGKVAKETKVELVPVAKSGLEGLFGASTMDASMASLFSGGAGPVTREVRPRTAPVSTQETSGDEDEESGEEEASGEEEESGKDEETDELADQPAPRKSKKSNDEDDNLEDRYFGKLMGEAPEPATAQPTSEPPAEPAAEAAPARKVDLKETELSKAESTVFVGNVSAEVISNKPLYRQFKQLFAAHGPVQSIRFRLIAFGEALPRKVAFVQHKLHQLRDSVNAYVVFGAKEDLNKALALNGSLFAGHHLRVDHVAHPAKQETKRLVFVGNLDFEEREEPLWEYFGRCGEVEYVRVVRDAKTNVGKGFAYVQFKDLLGVNKALLLNDKQMDTGDKKRKLRITRCKKQKARELAPAAGALNPQQRTKLGRAKKILGKADRATAGVVEGMRATKKDRITGIKKGGRIKKPRHRERSIKFKNERKQIREGR